MLKKLLILLFLLSIPFFVSADSVNQETGFFVDSSYDVFGRNQLRATLEQRSNKLYFYIDNDWWKKIDTETQNQVRTSLGSLSQEFEEKIYPKLTSAFGSEWKPGIDKDYRITVLLHPLKDNARGYYRTADGYSKIQFSDSNEREMVYLNANYITDDLAKSYLVHEFQHLINFYQKEKKTAIEEEVWLNEAIADYVPTLVGYNNILKGSYLEQRVNFFLDKPADSLTEWQGTIQDYAVINLFTHYLTDHYSSKVLIDALHSSKTGIEAINYALEKNGHKEDFSQIFSDWLIAVLVNDCNLGPKYCYLNKNLSNVKIVPSLNFLPYFAQSSLTVQDSIKDWSGNWYKIMGGRGDLNLEFESINGTSFNIRYLLCDSSEICSINPLLINNKKANLEIADFSKNYNHLIIVVFSQEKTSDFTDSEIGHPFSLKFSTKEEVSNIEALLKQIEFLKEEIKRVQAKIAAILQGQSFSCGEFNTNLYFGLKDNFQVRCLQEFLRDQEFDIYPEGLVTGNFLNLTKAAVIRFQEKYQDEILKPLNLEKGTGFVGLKTRVKINSLLKY